MKRPAINFKKKSNPNWVPGYVRAVGIMPEYFPSRPPVLYVDFVIEDALYADLFWKHFKGKVQGVIEMNGIRWKLKKAKADTCELISCKDFDHIKARILFKDLILM